MDNTNEPMSCHKALKIVNGLFYGGLGLLLLAWVASSLSRGNTVPVPAIVLCILGIVGLVSGFVLAYARLRCPHCDASLIQRGRLTFEVPNFCPACGKPLE